MRLPVTIALLLLAAFPLKARASTITVDVTSGTSAAFGEKACLSGTAASITYSMPSSFVVTGCYLTIFTTKNNSCSDEPADSDIVFLSETAVTSENYADTVTLAGKDFISDCPSNANIDFQVCVVVREDTSITGTTTETFVKESVTITYDSTQPSAPTITSAAGSDSAVTLAFDARDDIDHYVVYYKTHGDAPDEDDDLCGNLSSSSSAEIVCDSVDANCMQADAAGGRDASSWDASPLFDGEGYTSKTISDGTVDSVRIGGLVNDQEYEFVLVAVDTASNESAGSTPVYARPMTVHDFYRRYQCEGGQESGGFGCSTTNVAAVLVPVAGLVVAAFVRRRRNP